MVVDKQLKIKIYEYFTFDLFILDYFKYTQYLKTIHKNIDGKYFKLPKTNTFYKDKSYSFCLQLFTTTISNHTIFINKIKIEPYHYNIVNDSFCIIPKLVNKTHSHDYIFRSILLYETENIAIDALSTISDFFKNKYKLVIKGSFI